MRADLTTSRGLCSSDVTSVCACARVVQVSQAVSWACPGDRHVCTCAELLLYTSAHPTPSDVTSAPVCCPVPPDEHTKVTGHLGDDEVKVKGEVGFAAGGELVAELVHVGLVDRRVPVSWRQLHWVLSETLLCGLSAEVVSRTQHELHPTCVVGRDLHSDWRRLAWSVPRCDWSTLSAHVTSAHLVVSGGGLVPGVATHTALTVHGEGFLIAPTILAVVPVVARSSVPQSPGCTARGGSHQPAVTQN